MGFEVRAQKAKGRPNLSKAQDSERRVAYRQTDDIIGGNLVIEIDQITRCNIVWLGPSTSATN